MGLASFNRMRRQNLEKLTIQELRKLATAKGVEDVNKKTKQQLVMELT